VWPFPGIREDLVKAFRIRLGAALTAVLTGVTLSGTTGGVAHALSNPTNPQLAFARTITSHPFAGAPGNASDVEGLAYVAADNSLWVADDNGDRLWEVDATAGAYKSQLRGTDFQAATQVGTGKTCAQALESGIVGDTGANECLSRTDDFESVVYDSTADALYLTSGQCCTAGLPAGYPMHPTVWKLTRQSGHFVPAQWQALPDGQDPTAAGRRPGAGLYFGKGSRVKTYNFSTNAIGTDITLPVSNIVGITFTDANTAFVTTATPDTSTGRTTATSDSTIHRFDISGTTWTENVTWRFPLKSIGVPGGAVDDDGMIDARDLAIVRDSFFVSDGYDFRASGDHPIYVYQLGSAAPSVSIGDAAAVEGDTGSRAMRFTVSLSEATTRDVTVAYLTAGGDATAGTDYTARTGSVTIPAGATSATLSISVRGDTAVEAKESFGVWMHDPVGAVLGRVAGTGRIIDDDPSTGLRVAVGDGSVVEGRSGGRSLRMTVTLSAASTQNVTFAYTTVDGTAVASSDYTARSGTGTIPAGATSTEIAIAVRGDTTVEPTESFTVRISNAVGATIGRTNGVAKIMNDD
jgi:hypothetical protein